MGEFTGIKSIKIGRDGDPKIRANEPTLFTLYMTRALAADEQVYAMCYFYEPKYDDRGSFGTLCLKTKTAEKNRWIITEPPPPDECTVEITVPERLAGATLNITFSLMIQPSFYKMPDQKSGVLINADQLMQTVSVDVVSGEVKEPKIVELFWSDEKAITFGKLAPKRTKPLARNETVYLHIHTRGLYGKQVVCETNTDFTRNVTIRDNIACVPYTFHEDESMEITAYCHQERGYVEMEASIPYLTGNILFIPSLPTQVYASTGKRREAQYASEAKCRVDFRPKNNYDSSFGFSWYRIGDVNRSTGYAETQKTDKRTRQKFNISKLNDHPFCETDFSGKGIMGKHYEDDPNKKNGVRIVEDWNNSGTGSGVTYSKTTARDNFIADNYMAERHKDDYVEISMYNMYHPSYKPSVTTEYLIPVMTIVSDATQKQNEVTLKLFVRVLESPRQILFAFDNPRMEEEFFFSVTINGKDAEINNPPVTIKDSVTKKDNNMDIPNLYELKIKCNKPFDKEVRLKAYAVAAVNGQKMAEKKDGRVIPKVIQGMPLVLPDLCGMVRILPNDDAHWRTIDVVFYNVKTNIDGRNTYSGIVGDTREKSLKKFLQQAYVKANIKVEIIDLTNNPAYLGMCIDAEKNDGIKDTFDSDNYSNDLASLLKLSLGSSYNPDEYKIFFMPEPANTVYGFTSGSERRFTVCFSDASEATPIHELGHALDLPHTFDGNAGDGAVYTYEDGKTDNIMDYSQFVDVDQQSFFYWQWHTLNVLI